MPFFSVQGTLAEKNVLKTVQYELTDPTKPDSSSSQPPETFIVCANGLFYYYKKTTNPAMWVRAQLDPSGKQLNFQKIIFGERHNLVLGLSPVEKQSLISGSELLQEAVILKKLMAEKANQDACPKPISALDEPVKLRSTAEYKGALTKPQQEYVDSLVDYTRPDKPQTDSEADWEKAWQNALVFILSNLFENAIKTLKEQNLPEDIEQAVDAILKYMNPARIDQYHFYSTQKPTIGAVYDYLVFCLTEMVLDQTEIDPDKKPKLSPWLHETQVGTLSSQTPMQYMGLSDPQYDLLRLLLDDYEHFFSTFHLNHIFYFTDIGLPALKMLASMLTPNAALSEIEQQIMSDFYAITLSQKESTLENFSARQDEYKKSAYAYINERISFLRQQKEILLKALEQGAVSDDCVQPGLESVMIQSLDPDDIIKLFALKKRPEFIQENLVECINQVGLKRITELITNRRVLLWVLKNISQSEIARIIQAVGHDKLVEWMQTEHDLSGARVFGYFIQRLPDFSKQISFIKACELRTLQYFINTPDALLDFVSYLETADDRAEYIYALPQALLLEIIPRFEVLKSTYEKLDLGDPVFPRNRMNCIFAVLGNHKINEMISNIAELRWLNNRMNQKQQQELILSFDTDKLCSLISNISDLVALLQQVEIKNWKEVIARIGHHKIIECIPDASTLYKFAQLLIQVQPYHFQGDDNKSSILMSFEIQTLKHLIPNEEALLKFLSSKSNKTACLKLVPQEALDWIIQDFGTIQKIYEPLFFNKTSEFEMFLKLLGYSKIAEMLTTAEEIQWLRNKITPEGFDVFITDLEPEKLDRLRKNIPDAELILKRRFDLLLSLIKGYRNDSLLHRFFEIVFSSPNIIKNSIQTGDQLIEILSNMSATRSVYQLFEILDTQLDIILNKNVFDFTEDPRFDRLSYTAQRLLLYHKNHCADRYQKYADADPLKAIEALFTDILSPNKYWQGHFFTQGENVARSIITKCQTIRTEGEAVFLMRQFLLIQLEEMCGPAHSILATGAFRSSPTPTGETAMRIVHALKLLKEQPAPAQNLRNAGPSRPT